MMNWRKILGSQRKTGGESVYNDPLRSPFETDFDRIIFSHPFRRLQDKTQVHPLPEQDFVHTRLSHSLEVSSVGRSLGKYTGKIIIDRNPELKKDYNPHDFGAIVAAASLTHDIGNPPFGHSGEEAISDFFKFHDLGKEIHKIVDEVQWLDLTNFEGNAQGFRILNSPLYQGLSLTFATLAAFSKYPRPSHADKENGRKSHKKFGYFQSEKAIFRSLAEELELLPAAVGLDSWSRHPLTFLVEAADDICYGIIDLEDGCRLGLLTYKETEELLSPIIGAKFDPHKLEKYKNKEERIGLLRAMAIGQLIDECTEAFLGHEKELLTADFDKALTNVIPSNVFLEEIAKVSLERIYRAPKVVETETVGYEVLPGLLEVIIGAVFQKFNDPSKLSGRQKSIMRLIPEFHVLDIEQNKGNLYLQMLACTDFVSNMTDSAALSFYRKIKGIDLPKG